MPTHWPGFKETVKSSRIGTASEASPYQKDRFSRSRPTGSWLGIGAGAPIDDPNFDMTLPPGDLAIQITADPYSNGNETAFEGAEVKVRFTFADDSTVEVKFKP